MSSKKSRKVNLILLSGLIFTLFLVVGLPLFFFDKLADEDRDYKLSNQLNSLGKDLKEYKNKHNQYPKTLNAANLSDTICVNQYYTKCQQVYYKPSPDSQNFKMAMHAFSNNILFYHPDISHMYEEWDKYTEEYRAETVKQYGFMCVFCIAAPESTDPSTINDGVIYRKDPKVFANPEDWPKL
jgi:hypothetical protein